MQMLCVNRPLCCEKQNRIDTCSSSCNSDVSSTSLLIMAWASLHLLLLMRRSAMAPPNPVTPALTNMTVPVISNGVVAPTTICKAPVIPEWVN